MQLYLPEGTSFAMDIFLAALSDAAKHMPELQNRIAAVSIVDAHNGW